MHDINFSKIHRKYVLSSHSSQSLLVVNRGIHHTKPLTRRSLGSITQVSKPSLVQARIQPLFSDEPAFFLSQESLGDHAGSGSERKMTGTRLNYEQHRATSIFIVLSTPVTPTKRKHQKFLQKWCFVLKCLPRVNL